MVGMGLLTRHCTWRRLLLLLLLAAVCAIRLRFLQMPLDRDEGEYAYAGQLMLAGIPPYKLAYNMKLPGPTQCTQPLSRPSANPPKRFT